MGASHENTKKQKAEILTDAGQRETEWMRKAYPLPTRDSREQNWDYYMEAGNASDEKLFSDWISQVPGSLAPSHLVTAAVQCMRNRGYDVTKAERYIDAGLKAAEERDGAALQRITAKVYALLNRAPKDETSDYWNYHIYKDWPDIAANCTFPETDKKGVDVNSYNFKDRIKAGWTGQLIGGALGTQMEGYNTDAIEKVYGTVDAYLRPPETYNDDITYELAFLAGFEQYGYEITSVQIAEQWLACIAQGYSAEEVALRNLRLGLLPPESGTHLNYYSDWIGTQMRTMIHGMAAPGDPRLAAELAVRDGIISHSNSGLLGGVFNAVLVSLAFVETDVNTLVEKTVSSIPRDSEYFKVLDFAMEQCRKYTTWREAWRACEEHFSPYNWVHAYPNAAAEIVALFYGGGAFDKTASIVCMEGKDSDCTAAPVLNTLGVMGGTAVLTDKWTKPLGTTVKTILRGNKTFTLDELCDRTVKSVRRARENNKGM